MHTRDLILGAAVGVAAAFMFDPNSGGRRRALVRDKMVRAQRRTSAGLESAARDFANRGRGIAAATAGRLRREPVSDRRLTERVRAKLGRASLHPHAIDVEARSSVVTLRGPILADEVDDVLDIVASVRGVQEAVNELDVYETRDGIPGLQGESGTAGPGLELLQNNWAPATRVLLGAGLVATGVLALTRARSTWAA